MFISTFDIFKIGVGPSSSHTMGPMIAANRFCKEVAPKVAPGGRLRLRATLYGSLAYTGEGHGTHRAVLLGFMGMAPDRYDQTMADNLMARLGGGQEIEFSNGGTARLEGEGAIVINRRQTLPGHANGMTIELVDEAGVSQAKEHYYSIGGGFVLCTHELAVAEPSHTDISLVPYPFSNALQLLEMGAASGRTIAQMKRANELASMEERALDEGLDTIWAAMSACMARGLKTDGVLPGGLKVKRRAAALHTKLEAARRTNKASPYSVNDWLNAYAMAVNEENAAGGQVVTAPTNGAAGVIPAVLRYAEEHLAGIGAPQARVFMLTAAAIGGLIKANASISGAEVGCQGEIGSASAMAAAGLCAILGGSNGQIENAAEIALEHHLGMTCDPIGGLVQVPCIERNGMGAVKAVAAASLALHGDGTHFVPLDACIETMRQTGRDMDTRYKETSLGGLSVSVPEC
jgi:L-serine dehydratase